VYFAATEKGTCSKEAEFVSVSQMESLSYTTHVQQLGGQQVVLICRFGKNCARGRNLGRFNEKTALCLSEQEVTNRLSTQEK